MRAARFLMTVAATGLVALTAGHIVQNGEATAARIGASLQSPGMARAAVLPDVPILPRPPIATLQATPLPTTRAWVNMQPPSMNLQALDRSQFEAASAGCDPQISAVPIGGGNVRVKMSAPCNFNEPVTLLHAGLSFTELLTDTGLMSVDVPALTREVTIEAVMQNGEKAATTVDVPDAEAYHRVALVWRGNGGMHIHAQEFGAPPGTAGHIWAGSPGRVHMPDSGHLTTLGNRKLADASRAEVYTFPANTTNTDGVVRLSVQAEVQNTNCGGIIAAETIQPDGFGGVVSSDLTLRIPECGRVGEYLVLKNVLRDLKIASN